MADDLGWGDTGFNGNTIIKTPNLDRMAREGVVLDRFYSVGPVCSPTRGSFLTGRHYYRLGIWTANAGHLPKQEFTIARMLRSEGYVTGHFGKWHLGTLSRTISAKGPGRKPALHYAPPWERDYDESFVTESAVATWDPGYGPRAKNNPYYENGVPTMKNVRGCDSRVIMDRVVPFMERAVEQDMPFLAVVWFHAPHEQIIAGPDYLKMYEGHGEAAHFYGVVTALDDQVGRLRSEMERLGVASNTIVFFASDNGPEGATPKDLMKTRRAGSTGGLRGRKRSVYEGGIRVPAFVWWPSRLAGGRRIDTPMSVLDYLPTLSAICGAHVPERWPLDGENVFPVIKGKRVDRLKGIPIRHNNREESYAGWIQDEYKLLIAAKTDSSTDEFYNLRTDREERRNLIADFPAKAGEFRANILLFLESARRSHAGADYGIPDYVPADPWPVLGKLKKSKAR